MRLLVEHSQRTDREDEPPLEGGESWICLVIVCDHPCGIGTYAERTAEDVTPGQLPPDDGDQTVNNVTVTISKSRM